MFWALRNKVLRNPEVFLQFEREVIKTASKWLLSFDSNLLASHPSWATSNLLNSLQILFWPQWYKSSIFWTIPKALLAMKEFFLTPCSSLDIPLISTLEGSIVKPSTSWTSSAILVRAAIRGPGCPLAGAQVLIPPGACQPDSETPGISSQTFSPHHLDAGPHNNFFCCTMHSRLWPWISQGWRPVPCSTWALWFRTPVHASSRLLASTAKYSSCWAFVSLAFSLVASAAFDVQ